MCDTRTCMCLTGPYTLALGSRRRPKCSALKMPEQSLSDQKILEVLGGLQFHPSDSAGTLLPADTATYNQNLQELSGGKTGACARCVEERLKRDYDINRANPDVGFSHCLEQPSWEVANNDVLPSTESGISFNSSDTALKHACKKRIDVIV